MNVRFAYTVDATNRIYYGKSFGHPSVCTVSEADLLSVIYPSLATCYSIKSINEITISVLSCESKSIFEERDPFKYDFIYRSPTQIYLSGKWMSLT